jgi:hypothetical protein
MLAALDALGLAEFDVGVWRQDGGLRDPAVSSAKLIRQVIARARRDLQGPVRRDQCPPLQPGLNDDICAHGLPT